MRTTLFLILFHVIGFWALCQVPETPEELTDRLSRYSEFFQQEKAYLHLDKHNYLAGEIIWFNAYLLAATHHLPVCPSVLLYVELIDPDNELVASRNIKIDKGIGAGDIESQADWKAGVYLMRAYTSHMRNFGEEWIFSQEIILRSPYQNPSSKDSFETETVLPQDQPPLAIQFFPEGGEIVRGIDNRIAFKAVNAEGLGIAVEGQVIDDSGKELVSFSTEGLGMGAFHLMPTLGIAYQVKIMWEGSSYAFSLPKTINLGYNIQANLGEKDTLSLQLQSNAPNGLDGAYLIAHLRGQVFGLIPGLKGEKNNLKLDLSDIPSGIAHFTLFGSQGQPLAERLICLNRAQDYPLVQATGIEKSYGKREKVEFSLQMAPTLPTDSFATQVSMAVRDLRNLEHDRNIRTYLWLESDLQGPIEQLERLLDPQYAKLLDLLMMTQGWRRFTWDAFIAEKYPDLVFPVEQGFSIQGHVQNPYNPKKRVQSNISISSLSQTQFFMQELVSDEQGNFTFGQYPFEDSINLLIQARKPTNKSKKGKKKKNDDLIQMEGKKDVRIVMDDPESPEISWPMGQGKTSFPREEWILNAQDSFRVKQLAFEQGILNVELEEVTIESRLSRFERPFTRPNMLYRDPDSRLVLDSLPGGSQALTVFDLIKGRVPGVEIIGTPFVDQTARIRGISSLSLSSTATILVDGVQVDPVFANLIPVPNVEFIDVLRNLSKTAVYGAAGAGGIIAIYTRQGISGPSWKEKELGVINYLHPGYYKVREFYSPAFPKERSMQDNDFRTTLHWEPMIDVGTDGRVNVTFFTSDISGTFEINLEGINARGLPIAKNFRFKVE